MADYKRDYREDPTDDGLGVLAGPAIVIGLVICLGMVLFGIFG